MILLCEALKSHREANALKRLVQRILGHGADDCIAALNLLGNSRTPQEHVERRIRKTLFLCSNMQPAAEDVIAILLQTLVRSDKVKQGFLEHRFSGEQGARYYRRILAYISAASAQMNGAEPSEEAVDDAIMVQLCDQAVDKIIKTANISHRDGFKAVYRFAKNACYRQTHRLTGEPYIVHLVEVTRILSEIVPDTLLLEAALLHGILEHTDYTERHLAERFGEPLARLVSAVTAERDPDELTDGKEAGEGFLAGRDYNFYRLSDLVAKDQSLLPALYVKGADLLHNLRTIDVTPEAYRQAKADETKEYYLPLFKRYHMSQLARLLEEQVWRIEHINIYDNAVHRYNDMLAMNEEYICYLEGIFDRNLGENINSQCRAEGIKLDFKTAVKRHTYLPHEVYRMLKEKVKDEQILPKHINRDNLPLCDLDIYVDVTNYHQESVAPEAAMAVFYRQFVKYLLRNQGENGWVIVDLGKSVGSRYRVKLLDRYGAAFQIYLATDAAHWECRVGQIMRDVDTALIMPVKNDEKSISVHLKDGQRIRVPEGATVIDVAFKIHPDIGFTLFAAWVNGTKVNITHKLVDGDKVVVAADAQNTSDPIRCRAEIYWLNHVATEFARKKLTRYFHEVYELHRSPNNKSFHYFKNESLRDSQNTDR